MASRDYVTNIDLVQNNDPSVPASGFTRIKAKPDGVVYIITPDGAEIGIAANSSGSSVPTTASEDYVVGDNQQVLFRRTIKMPAGTKIIVGSNSVLVGV